MIEDIRLFGNVNAGNCFLILTDRREEATWARTYEAVRVLRPDRERLLVFVPVEDWNRDLSPWKAEPVFGKEGFGDGAAETLSRIGTELLPYLERQYPREGRRFFVCGYSLAGLFALWAVCRTDAFSGVAGVSPSVWFPGWLVFAKEHPVRCGKVYLSLGDREERARNPLLASVGNAIREQEALLSGSGVPVCLEWNPGNHFADADGRLARGIAWLEQEDA